MTASDYVGHFASGVWGRDGGIPGAASPLRIGCCHNGTMTDGSGEPVSENDLITRLARDRREGRDTTQDVRELLKLAARANRAALDRLAE